MNLYQVFAKMHISIYFVFCILAMFPSKKCNKPKPLEVLNIF